MKRWLVLCALLGGCAKSPPAPKIETPGAHQITVIEDGVPHTVTVPAGGGFSGGVGPVMPMPPQKTLPPQKLWTLPKEKVN